MSRLTLHWHLRAIVARTSAQHDVDAEVELEAWVGQHYSHFLAVEALEAEDAVEYLDAVTRDPVVDFQLRHDAKELLTYHILEERIKDKSIRSHNDPVYEEWIESDLPCPRLVPSWSTLQCSNCWEMECLYDFDADKPTCHCGTRFSIPQYGHA